MAGFEWLGALPVLTLVNKYRINRALGQRHRDGHKLLHQLRTEGVRVHESQRLVVAWVEDTHKFLAVNVPDRASIFLGDFETTKSNWAERQSDRTMLRIDKVIEDLDAPLSDPAGRYRQAMVNEPAQMMREKLDRLEEIIKR